MGSVLYVDNEAVLNSRDVKGVCEEFGMEIRNSCEYQPWQNPAERDFQEKERLMRIQLARGCPDDQAEKYWDFAVLNAQHIIEATTHRDPREGDITPTERRTGEQPKVGHMRVLFCAAYVRTPERYRAGKTGKRAERALTDPAWIRGQGTWTRSQCTLEHAT